MNQEENRKAAANYMGAIAHLLSGRPGAAMTFIERVELMIAGSEPDVMRLMQVGDRVQRSGRPFLWFHLNRDSPNVPQIGLAALVRDRMFCIENCLLWSPAPGARAHLIPDSFEFGSFRFDDRLRLRHWATPPIRDHEAATSGIVRACVRLREIEAGQRDHSEKFALPQLMRAA